MVWSDYSYLFAFAMIAAFVDAYGIGANDVANSWATSVSSRSVTYRQAMILAGLCEFLGAVLAGARVTKTIKGGIIDLAVFQDDAGVILLGFTCVCVASATWLTFATRNAMPVSTTHTVIGALIGLGIALDRSGGAVRWGWRDGSGVAAIFASWGISPLVAGSFASIVFLFTKFGVLRSKNPVHIGLLTAPMYFFAVAAVLTTSIIAKGAPSLNLDELSPGATAGAILGTAAVVMILSILFWLPYVHSQVVKKDYTVRWYHFFLGPLLWRREPPADAGTIGGKSVVKDYYKGHKKPEDGGAPTVPHDDPEHLAVASSAAGDSEKEDGATADGAAPNELLKGKKGDEYDDAEGAAQTAAAREKKAADTKLGLLEKKLAGEEEDLVTGIDGRPPPPAYRKIEGSPIEPWNLWTIVRYNAWPWLVYSLTAGMRTDIHKMQSHGSSDSERTRLADMHGRAAHFDNEAEHLYSFLQVMTACTASFAHGSNDVSNAIGPLTVVFQTWRSRQTPSSEESVPVWILVYGGAAIVLGLGTYGWKLMSVLGNRLTLHSPSRGFSMEIGASLTVVLASYLGLPISSTQSITGATVGVALCNGDIRAMNWKMLSWIFFSWVLTLPIAGLLSGCLFAIIANAPRAA